MAQSKLNPLYGRCDKCATANSELFEYDGKWLCRANECFMEEVEKDSGKQFRDQDKLSDYKKLVQGTK